MYVYYQDFFGKSDPYLEFSRAKEDGSFVVIYRTEVCTNGLDIIVILY